MEQRSSGHLVSSPHAQCGITKKCTGVAGRAQSEINVAGGNPLILVVLPTAYAELASNIDPFHLGVHCVCRGHDRVHDEVPQHHIDA